ncbi:MAG: hypothetical protein MUD14_20305 [Hydrococcus sp. Prado102]|jgi:hypothetical protein|nr:hypothetical protein [Hydrococcus sp. Prado102]
MANITISNLNPVGSELFSDSESYLNQISEEELKIQGGLMSTGICATAVLTIAIMASRHC